MGIIPYMEYRMSNKNFPPPATATVHGSDTNIFFNLRTASQSIWGNFYTQKTINPAKKTP